MGESLYSFVSSKSKEAADALKHEFEGALAKPKTLTPEEAERVSREYSHRSRATGGFGGRASLAEPSAREDWASERSSVRDSVRLSIRDDAIMEEMSTHPSGSTITDEPVDDTLVKMSRDALDEAQAAADKVHECHERLAELLGQKEEHSTTLDELQRVRRSSAHERDSHRRSRQEQAMKQDTSWTWVRTFFRPAGKTFEEVARMQADCMQARHDAKEALGLLADIEQRLHRLGFAFALDAPDDQWEEASTKVLPLPLGGNAGELGEVFPQQRSSIASSSKATKSNPSSSTNIGAPTERLTKGSSSHTSGRVTGNWRPRDSSVSLKSEARAPHAPRTRRAVQSRAVINLAHATARHVRLMCACVCTRRTRRSNDRSATTASTFTQRTSARLAPPRCHQRAPSFTGARLS